MYLAPTLYQVYQATLTAPANMPSGDHVLLVTVNGISSPPMRITVQ